MQANDIIDTPVTRGLRFEPRLGMIDGCIKGAQACWWPVTPKSAQRAPGTDESSSGIPPAAIGSGDSLIRAACALWADWAPQIPGASGALRLSLDAWPEAVEPQQFADMVRGVIDDTGIGPHQLNIICRESRLRVQMSTAAQALAPLRSMGLTIELLLDDPGQGYSTFLCLRCLPLDRINIPARQIGPEPHLAERLSVLRTLISMAHGMHLDVVASEVDNPARRAGIERLGVHAWQGAALGAPRDPDTFLAELTAAPPAPNGTVGSTALERILLLVDDEENILAALRRLFRRDGYRILTATSAAAGLELLKTAKVDVIVSDQRMPGMTGVDFLRRAKALYPDTMRMTLSGYADLQSIIDAVNEGSIYKFLTKPWEDDRLREHVAEAFRQKEMADENRRLNEEVANANAELAHLNERMARMLVQQQDQASLMAASADGVHALLDDLPVALIGVDPDGLLVYSNSRARSLLGAGALSPGLPASDAVAKLCGQILPSSGAETPERCLVGPHSCWAWHRRVSDTRGADRGVMLTLMPCLAPNAIL